ncbi:MAG: hypothetical protein PWQ12_479 [Clostridiales bacterium]|jgi:amidohydrolase|nr:hypothetical protein [Clostridiales bacterium]
MKQNRAQDSTYIEIAAYADWLTDLRIWFHQHPELSEHEFGTRDKITATLDALAIPWKPCADTGVCGWIEGTGNDELKPLTIGLRADIDALPISEPEGRSYRSQNEGVMHACGHDGHTTILLGVAKYFSERRSAFNGTIKLFFQPAEETVGGAQRMVDEGCMKAPDVDYVLGLHVMPYLEVGQIETRHGKLNAASDGITIDIEGMAAHGAYPEKGIDAMVIAAQVILGIQTLVSRTVSPLESAVITLGKISGGLKDNIICNTVHITGGMRTADEGIRSALKEKLTTLVEGICKANGGTGHVAFEPGYNALINTDTVVDVLQKEAAMWLGAENVFEKAQPSMGVEDFSFFLDHAKGAFYHLGCGNASRGITSALHTAGFDLDMDCLPMGVFLQVKFIEAIFRDRP